MFEKVNPAHPDKVADRIAGAIVDYAYKAKENPKIAVEVLLGHGECNIIVETDIVNVESNDFTTATAKIKQIARRFLPSNYAIRVNLVPQDPILNGNQKDGFRCGDNGIFKGVPISTEEWALAKIAESIYALHKSDGKYILDAETNRLVICQSNAIDELSDMYPGAVVNPLGNWTGGPEVDSGATNRKIGSDMGRAATGGGLHGKDLSKADVSVNIYAHLKAQETGKPVEICCAIGDNVVDGKPYSEIVKIAKKYIDSVGGFEKFAEWGLIR